jgi:hypothetical protein
MLGNNGTALINHGQWCSREAWLLLGCVDLLKPSKIRGFFMVNKWPVMMTAIARKRRILPTLFVVKRFQPE